MNEEPTKDLSQRAFQQRVLAEFAALRGDVGELRGEVLAEVGQLRAEVGQLRAEVAELRTQQTAMAKNIAALDRRLTSVEQRLTSVDHRLTSLEKKVDTRLKETRPIWEAVKAQIEKLDAKFDNFIHDLYEARADLVLHEKRLDKLDRRVLA